MRISDWSSDVCSSDLWGVSVGAMIMRSQALDLIGEDEARRMWINYNRRGWRGHEPLDNKIEKERPPLIRRSFELLISEGVQSPAEIMAALPDRKSTRLNSSH